MIDAGCLLIDNGRSVRAHEYYDDFMTMMMAMPFDSHTYA
jgi:hypothetical protein